MSIENYQEAIQYLRDTLRGPSGSTRYLFRQVRKMDLNGDGLVSLDEFRHCINSKFEIQISDVVLNKLFKFLGNGRQEMRILDMFTALKGRIESRRLRLINLAFVKLDTDQSGSITKIEINRFYDSRHFPEIARKRYTKDELVRSFFKRFDRGEDPAVRVADGQVTWHEFHDYYWEVSWHTESDADFEKIIREDWHVTKADIEAYKTLTKWSAPAVFPQPGPVYCHLPQGKSLCMPVVYTRFSVAVLFLSGCCILSQMKISLMC